MQGTLFLAIYVGVSSAGPTVVASPSAEVTTLTRKEARHLFTFRSTSWSNGTPVRIVLPLANSVEDNWLSEDLLGLPPDVYQRFLAEQAYRKGYKIPARADKAGVIKEVEVAGTSAGVVSVVSTPTAAPLVPVVIDGK